MAHFYPKVFVLILIAACTAAFTTTKSYADDNYSTSTTDSKPRDPATSESSSSESNSSESGLSNSDSSNPSKSELNSSESSSEESESSKPSKSESNSSESSSEESESSKPSKSESNSSESSSEEDASPSAKFSSIESSTSLPASFAASTVRAAEQDTLSHKIQTLSEKVQMIYDHVMSQEKKDAVCSRPTNKMHTIPAEISTLEQTLPQDTFEPKPCGGFIEHFSETELVHQFPETYPPGYEQGCIWIVWTNSPSNIRIQSIPDNEAQFHKDFLVRTYTTDSYGSEKVEGLGSGNSSVSVSTSTNSPFILIHFYGKPTKRGQGLHLRLVNSYRENSVTPFTPKLFELDETARSGILSYPIPPETQYGPYELVFIMGTGMDTQSMNVTIKDINTEISHDWLRVFWMDYRHLTKKLRMTTKTSGYPAPDLSFHFNQAVPFVLVFNSDGSNFGTGFKINYDYYDASTDQPSSILKP